MTSFGEESIDSGSWVIPDAPYFIGIFLAVLLAILIAPHIQSRADAIWTGVTRIQFVQKNGVFLSFYLVGAVLIWTMVMIILPQSF